MVKRYGSIFEPHLIGKGIYDLLASMGGTRERSLLAGLWANWTRAVGEDFANIAVPLGSRGRVLVLAAASAIQMQELHFLGDELLERVNSYLGTNYFESVRPGLAESGKFCPIAAAPAEERRAPGCCPGLSGEYLGFMDRSSPVAACYARFAGR